MKIVPKKKPPIEVGPVGKKSCFTCEGINICIIYSGFKNAYENFGKAFPDKNEVSKIFDAIGCSCRYYKPKG